MKKSELKNIIKECVKEVIFEEGVLSGIISEVAQGLNGVGVVTEQRTRAATDHRQTHLAETKKQVLNAIGGDAYADIKKQFKDPGVFEGTRPIAESNGRGPLSGIDPRDPGVDLSSIPGMNSWASIASSKGKR
jgi:hypothetical protein